MRLTFHGATESVSGSRFLVEEGRSRLLVDCGLFQGLKRLRLLNWEPFPVDPAELDAVVLTHAHIDHCGYLPALARDGFSGSIWCSEPTADLLELMLLDAAYLQEEDARYANRHRTSRHRPALPLFTVADAHKALDLVRRQRREVWFDPCEGMRVRLGRAGHILGASTVTVEGKERSVLFTGDVGRPNDPVMRAPDAPPSVDVVVTESTYGNKVHPPTDPLEELGSMVRRTVGRGGTVLIPAFAVGRTQTVLHLLAELRESGGIPEVPVFLNSPMAIGATEIMLAHRDEHRLSGRDCARLRDGVRFVRSTDDSKQLMTRSGPMVVVSASGMATGGRVLHHLMRLLPDHRNLVLFTGFQAMGTRGASLLDGADEVKIFGKQHPVRAEIQRLDGLSAHADRRELLAWLGSGSGAPERSFVVHGEPAAADAFRRELHDVLGWDAEVPLTGSAYEI